MDSGPGQDPSPTFVGGGRATSGPSRMKDDRREARPSRRRFRLLDAMALVGATALGLAWARWAYAGRLRPESGQVLWWLLRGPPTCLVAAWAPALLLLRLRRPRPRRGRLVQQPGLIACAAAVASMLLGLGGAFAFLAVHTQPPRTATAYSVVAAWPEMIERTPEFVLGAWVALGWAGRWSPERSWVDRAGRAAGLFWVAGLALTVVAPALVALFPAP